MENVKTKPAFGSKVPRFSDVGLHPLLRKLPDTYKYRHLAPSYYKVDVSKKIIFKVPSWKRTLELEDFSRNLGYKSKKIIKEKKYMESIKGPAWADIPPLPIDKGIKFFKSERFKTYEEKSFTVPGPGTYGKNHDPYKRYEEKSHAKGFSHSVLPSFEQYSNKPRSLSELPYSMPPNMYNIKGSVDELISKRTSKRGPYDLFSGERFRDLPPQKARFLKIPNFIISCNRFKGRFSRYGRNGLKTFRLAWRYKNGDDQIPGPGHYDPYAPKKVAQSLAPFNTGKNPRPSIKCTLHPPPTRYNVEIENRIKGDGMKSVFLSKTKRMLFKSNTTSWFE